MAGDSDGNYSDILMFAPFGSGNIAAAVSVILFLFVLSFFLSYFCGAISAASAGIIKKKAEEDNSRSAGRALRILENSEKYCSFAKASCAVCLAAVVMICEYSFMPVLGIWLSDVFVNTTVGIWFSAAALFFIPCIIFLCFGIFLPGKIGERKPDAAVLRFSGSFTIASLIFQPIVGISCLLSNIIVRLLRYNTKKISNQQTEEEILLMVDKGEENGSIEGNTKDMIENVFDFDDTTVGEIMTHRKDVVAVKRNAGIADIAGMAIESGRSRIPVYNEDIDDIVGIIYVKDLLKFVNTNPPKGEIGENIIKPAVFVPQSKRCSEMFEYMTAHKTQIAVVVDEFGGTGGIITMEDLIESIVGNIQDEYDNEDDEIKQLNEYSFTVDGATALDEITELTGISFEDDDNDTLAGIMLDRMGHIPKDGEHPSVVINGTRFTVQEVESRRISKVLIVKNHSVPAKAEV